MPILFLLNASIELLALMLRIGKSLLRFSVRRLADASIHANTGCYLETGRDSSLLHPIYFIIRFR